MIDRRTWDQVKKHNEGAPWIDENGDFCKDFIRDLSDPFVRMIIEGEDAPEWAKTGFNGCWSCKNMGNCKRRELALQEASN